LSDLADVDGELAALLGGVLVGAESVMDAPVKVWQSERVGRGTSVELLVGVGEAVVGVIESLDDLDIAIEQGQATSKSLGRALLGESRSGARR
jgi:hypothetical protein